MSAPATSPGTSAPAKTKWGSLGARIVTALVLMAIVLGGMYVGGKVWEVLLMLGVIRMAYEWYRMIGPHDRNGSLAYMIGVGGACGIILIAYSMTADLWLSFLAAIVSTTLVLATVKLLGHGPLRWRRLLTGLVYILAPFTALIWLRGDDHGFDAGFQRVFFVLLVVAAADVGAYFAGKIIGGPKFIPRLSPNKTWAGCGGGVVLGALFGGLLAEWMSDDFFDGAIIGAVLVVAAIAGDFLESGAKRRFGVKDTGRLLPGHGGLLDRFDSHMAAFTVAAVVIALAPQLSPV